MLAINIYEASLRIPRRTARTHHIYTFSYLNLTPLAALTAIDMYLKPTRTAHDAQPFPLSMWNQRRKVGDVSNGYAWREKEKG